MKRRKSRTHNGPTTCPKCNSISVARIVYGLPSEEMFLQSQEGKIVLGGCVIMGDDPDRQCNDCGHRWRVGRG